MNSAIVVGAGIAGASVALELVRRGVGVQLVDSEGIPNLEAPSAGDTRVFRMAYFEAPEYVPFLKAAKEEWLELAGDCDLPLFEESGVLMVGREDSDLVVGARRSLEAFPTRAEVLSPDELAGRYPHIRFREGEWGVVDLEGGFLHSANAYRAVLRKCEAAGVEFLPYTEVRKVEEVGNGVLVNGHLRADKAVVCAGLGFRRMDLLGRRSSVWGVRQVLTYWTVEDGERWEGHPAFAFEQEGSLFYGIPPNASCKWLKVAEHRQARGADAEIDFVAAKRVAEVKSERFEILGDEPAWSKVCHYDMTRGGDLALGLVPGSEPVGVIGSMSGHGFKMAPAVAQAVVSALLDGESGVIPERMGAGKLFL